MTSVAPKPDSEELFGRTQAPETAADPGKQISPSASRSKTIIADSAVPGGSLEETQPAEEEKMGDAKQTALESPQEQEIAEALFDLANTADAAGHSPREGRGESDAPEEAEPASSGGGLVQSRKRPRKPNRNLDAYQGFHDDDTDELEMERAPPRKSWASREVAASEGPIPEPVPSHIQSGGRRNLPGNRGSLSDLDGKACMRHVHIARRILAAQGGKKPASRTSTAPRAPSSFVPQPSGGAPPGLPQGLGISVGGPGVGPGMGPPGSLRGGPPGWRQEDARTALEAHLAARLGLSGPRQLEQVLSSLPPNSLGALASLLARQQPGGGAGQGLAGALRGLDQRGYPGPQGHGPVPYGYANAPAHGPPPPGGPLRGAPAGGLPELLAQVLAQQQQHGGLYNAMAPQRGLAYNRPAPPPGISPAAARLQQLYATHTGQQGPGAGFGGNDLRQQREQQQQHSGPDVASVLRTLQGLQHAAGGAAAALQRPHHPQYGAGSESADASRQGQLVQLAKLVQAALAGGGAPRGGKWAAGAPPSHLSVGGQSQQQGPGGPPLSRETNPVAAVAAAYVAAHQQQQGNAAAPPRLEGSKQAGVSSQQPTNANGNGTQQRASSSQQQLFSRGDSAAQLAALFAAQQQLTRRPSGGTTTSQSLGGGGGAILEGSAPTGSMREIAAASLADAQQQRSSRSTPEPVVNPPQLDLDPSIVAVPKPEVVDDNEQTSSEATMPLGAGKHDNDVAEVSATSAAANDTFDVVPKSEDLLQPVLQSSGGEERAAVHPNGALLGQSESVLANTTTTFPDQALIKQPIDVKSEGIPPSGEPALSSNGGAALPSNPEDNSIVLPSAGAAPSVDLGRLLASVQGRVNTPEVQDLLRHVLAQLEGR